MTRESDALEDLVGGLNETPKVKLNAVKAFNERAILDFLFHYYSYFIFSYLLFYYSYLFIIIIA